MCEEPELHVGAGAAEFAGVSLTNAVPTTTTRGDRGRPGGPVPGDVAFGP